MSDWQTPEAMAGVIFARLNSEVVHALQTQDVKEQFSMVGATASSSTLPSSTR